MGGPRLQPLSRTENLVLTAIGYFQPITRGELWQLFGKEVSRDLIGQLRALNFIAAGPRSPQPGAPYTYVTTKHFLSHFGFETLRDLPDMEQLEEAGLLSKQKLLAGAVLNFCGRRFNTKLQPPLSEKLLKTKRRNCGRVLPER